MKRYRVISADFDSRAALLDIVIQEEWEEQVKESHRQGQQQIREGLVAQYGPFRADEKLRNFRDLGPKSWSIIAYHNTFAAQARDAFVIGAFYPALTAACALGERILSQLVIALRDEFRATPEYAWVARRQSFDNWGTAINVLAAWDVLLPEVATAFHRLANVRNTALHFNPETDQHARRQALKAIGLLDTIISNQFGSLGVQPWFIPDVRGASFIKRSCEDDPFVRLIYLPNSHLVGPCHTLEFTGNRITVHDDHPYEAREISDDEFRALQESRCLRPGTPCENS